MITEEMARLCVPPRGFLNSWVTYGYYKTDCNLTYHILGGLLLLTQTFPPHLNFTLGARTYGNLFGMAVGESTNSRKTTSLKLAKELLEDVFGGAQNCPVVMAPASDAGTIDQLARTPRCLIVYEELGDFLKAAQQGPLSQLKTKYTELYDAGATGRLLSAKRGRNGELINDNRIVEQPRLSVGAAVNQTFLEDLTTSTDWTGGFLARFLTMYAHRERFYALTEDQPGLYATCKEQMLQFLDLGLLIGPCLGLDEDAKKIWLEWNSKLASLEKRQGIHPHAVASLARAPAMALKIAMLLMWDIGGIRAVRDSPWRITAEALYYGCAIANLHVHSVLTLLPTLAGTKDEREARNVLREVANAGEPLSLGQVMDRAHIVLKRRAQELIESLCEQGKLRRVQAMGSRVAKYGLGSGADALARDPSLALDMPAPPPQQQHEGAQVIQLPLRSEGQTNNGSGESSSGGGWLE